MPVKSDAQRRFMYASLAGKTDVPPSVAKKFVGPKAHAEGGSMKESKEMIKKEVSFMKKKGAPKSMIKHEMAEAKGKTKKMSSGGFTRAADGIAAHGRTKATQVKMMGGGKC